MTKGADLDQPLGQHRRRAGPSRGAGFGWRIALATVFIGIFAASAYIALDRTPLQRPQAASADSVTIADADAGPPEVAATETADAAPPAMSDGQSGANITRTLTEDGTLVTTFSPRDRDGPQVLSANGRIGQSPRFAHQPLPELLEQTAAGQLPVIAADGRRPVDAYARPWSGAHGTRMAIVVGGLGLSQTGTQYAIDTLPETVTLAFAASGNSLQRWLQEARRGGHEVLLQVPFEPFDYPANDPGPHTLVVADGPQQNLADLHWAMARITNYTGIMNFMGGRFLSDAAATEAMMRDLAGRGLLFLDDGSAAQTVTGPVARAVGVPFALADLVIDTRAAGADILKRLDDAERIARRNGQAIAVASAFTASVDAIAEFVDEARRRGIEIVAVSALADDPERR